MSTTRYTLPVHHSITPHTSKLSPYATSGIRGHWHENLKALGRLLKPTTGHEFTVCTRTLTKIECRRRYTVTSPLGCWSDSQPVREWATTAQRNGQRHQLRTAQRATGIRAHAPNAFRVVATNDIQECQVIKVYPITSPSGGRVGVPTYGPQRIMMRTRTRTTKKKVRNAVTTISPRRSDSLSLKRQPGGPHGVNKPEYMCIPSYLRRVGLGKEIDNRYISRHQRKVEKLLQNGMR
ncbi:hypothetical protein BJ912DRAFT_1044707 [Pholiota molesta]|nr:hypothetical protein BJ912DRAFT_1044707 [Pholiota molesta]